jgi:hypothetical protein
MQEDVQLQEQDTGVSEARKGDKNWARERPVVMIPTQERLALPHSVVTIRNTSPDQKHIVIDRHHHGHELFPGQSKRDVEMLNSDVEYFLGRHKRGHPVVIEGAELRQQEDKSSVVGETSNQRRQEEQRKLDANPAVGRHPEDKTQQQQRK